jgi:hypothetical protein
MEKAVDKAFRMMLAGAPPDLLYGEFRSHGLDPYDAVRRTVDIYEHAKRAETFRHNSREHAMWIASVRRQLRSESGKKAIDEIFEPITPDDFFESYYIANRPLLFRGLLKWWRTFSGWSLDSIEQRFGNVMVEVAERGDDERERDRHPEAHRRKMQLADFIQYARSSESPDLYLMAANNALQRVLTELKAEIEPLPGVLTKQIERDKGEPFLWLGPKGTITHLHHDVLNVLHVLLEGSKRFILVPPEDAVFVYNDAGVFTEVDAANPDLKRHPLFQFACRFDVTIEPGDAVFIPVGWWHYVEALTPTLAVSMGNFTRVNLFARAQR